MLHRARAKMTIPGPLVQAQQLQTPGPVSPVATPTSDPPANKAASNTRFRSFAERYLIERANTFRVGHEDEDAWVCIGHAKTAYNMVKERGRTLGDDT